MSTSLDIEDFNALLGYLREKGRIAPGETPKFRQLTGGVSNRTILVERTGGEAFVIKQALERLRVATEWVCDPARITREALGLIWLERFAPAGTITPLLFLDEEQHLLAMQAVPHPHENWKTVLLAGGLRATDVEQFAALLACIHQASREHCQVATVFADRTFFDHLRLQPYYRYTAAQVPTARKFLEGLIAETLSTRLALVHGDYSPKNVLVHKNRLVLLDHEVIHFGDPAFDIGFSVTHLLSKAHYLPDHRAGFAAAAHQFWKVYTAAAGEFALTSHFEARAVQHTLACLLARARGRSPLEYLAERERCRQVEAVLRLMTHSDLTFPGLITAFVAYVSN